MDINMIAPELRGRVRWMPTMRSQTKFSLWLGRRITRMIPSSKVDGVDAENHRGAPRMRLYRPRNVRTNAALLWIHGGGFMMGAPAMDDHFCAETCRSLGITIASVDYRFAPEHPFPAPMDDALAVWDWLQASTKTLGIDGDRIVLGGQSAGGGLAAGLIQRIHDAGGPRALGQWLFCPMLDDRTVNRHELDSIDYPLWSNRSNLVGWTAYLGGTPGGFTAPPYASPSRREDLAGLPPAWIGVGDIDLFFDEDRAYAERLRQAGVDATFVQVSGAPHGFEGWARNTVLGRTYLKKARSWLGDIVGAPYETEAALQSVHA
ncbi:esterase [Acidocella aquatica]|uniref:Esterase n=1 Tax=Acidocella aquatica TaxID=1922313 RepID=A0ABQ6ABA8_9PROT|nr:alpha/beta hydrolase [Acidocella aquatica]GLR68071.1 esterase [Acidocella aquatica]